MPIDWSPLPMLPGVTAAPVVMLPNWLTLTLPASPPAAPAPPIATEAESDVFLLLPPPAVMLKAAALPPLPPPPPIDWAMIPIEDRPDVTMSPVLWTATALAI